MRVGFDSKYKALEKKRDQAIDLAWYYTGIYWVTPTGKEDTKTIWKGKF